MIIRSDGLGAAVRVKDVARVELGAQDYSIAARVDGQPREEKLRDFAARVVQHEVDHLNGILFIDKMSPAKKFAIKRKLANLKAETEEELGLA